MRRSPSCPTHWAMSTTGCLCGDQRRSRRTPGGPHADPACKTAQHHTSSGRCTMQCTQQAWPPQLQQSRQRYSTASHTLMPTCQASLTLPAGCLSSAAGSCRSRPSSSPAARCCLSTPSSRPIPRHVQAWPTPRKGHRGHRRPPCLPEGSPHNRRWARPRGRSPLLPPSCSGSPPQHSMVALRRGSSSSSIAAPLSSHFPR